MASLFHTILYQPIFNIFIWLYNVIPGHDVGIVIIAVTVLVRLILYPLTNSSIKAQKSMQELQPKMAAIKKEYAGDQQKQTQAIMELYKNNKVNPLSSCLPLIIQLLILIALYTVLQDALASNNLANSLYSFVANPGKVNPISLGIFDMGKPNAILAVLAGAAQFWQAKTMGIKKQPPKEAGEGSKDEAMMSMMNKQMMYFMPVMTMVIGLGLPAGLTLYWFFGTLLMALQQILINRKIAAANPPAQSV